MEDLTVEYELLAHPRMKYDTPTPTASITNLKAQYSLPLARSSGVTAAKTDMIFANK
jgi:hypothetical protein